MWPSIVPILTILTFLGSVAAMQPLPRAVFADRALSAAASPSALAPTGSPSIGSTSSSTTSTDSSTTITKSTSTRTSLESLTTDLSTSQPDTIITQPSSSSTTSRASRSRSIVNSTPAASLFTPTFAPPISDGPSFTVTAVVSRPTGTTADEGASPSKTGFFANKGAVVGTFLIAGLLGTASLLCVFLWGLHKCRRRRSDQAYFEDEYKEFNRDHSGTTPEPTLPTTDDPDFNSPVPRSPTPNMIERLHGTDPLPNVDFNHAQEYVRASGDFDPYKVHGVAYENSDDRANNIQHAQVSQGRQQTPGEPSPSSVNVTTPQAGVELSGNH